MTLDQFIREHIRQDVTQLVHRLHDGAFQAPGSTISDDLALLCGEAEALMLPTHSTQTEFYAVTFATDADWEYQVSYGGKTESAQVPQLAEWLRAEGERVLPLAGMMVWARIAVLPYKDESFGEGETEAYFGLSADPILTKIWKEAK